MKRKGSFLIFIFLLIASIVAFTYDVSSETISREKVNLTYVKSEIIQNGIEIERQMKEGRAFTSSINIPISNIMNIDEHIKSWAQHKEDEFFFEIDAIQPSLSKNAEAHFVIEPIVNKVAKEWLTYEMYVQYIVSDPFAKEEIFHSEVKTFVVNLKNGEFVHLQDVISIPQTEKDSEVTSLMKIIPNEEDIKRFKKQHINHIDDMQWILTKKGLLFLVENDKQKHAINHIFIEYKQLENYLTDSYKNKFLPKKTEKLKKSNKSNKKLIALTFDDGPDNKVTTNVLKTLKEYDVKATFFMLGNSVDKYPKIAKKVAAEGHEIANHSNTHVNLNSVKRSRIEYEVEESKKIIENVTGQTPKFFRPPYGEYNNSVLEIANKTEQQIIMWSVDTLDWQHRNKNRTYEIIKHNIQPGSIILMHDIHQSTADALPKVIKQLQKKGYEFVTVSQLIKEIDHAPNGIYYGK